MAKPGTPDDPMSESHAHALDAVDPLAQFRKRFHIPPGTVYLDGNSLGLLSIDAECAVLATLDWWKTQGFATNPESPTPGVAIRLTSNHGSEVKVHWLPACPTLVFQPDINVTRGQIRQSVHC